MPSGRLKSTRPSTTSVSSRSLTFSTLITTRKSALAYLYPFPTPLVISLQSVNQAWAGVYTHTFTGLHSQSTSGALLARWFLCVNACVCVCTFALCHSPLQAGAARDAVSRDYINKLHAHLPASPCVKRLCFLFCSSSSVCL